MDPASDKPTKWTGHINRSTARALAARSQGHPQTERRLLYVACIRAREHFLLTGVILTSEYLADFMPQ
jgi:ATP-dependent exoDNAse (exonuclease V) beta subunit